MKGSFPRALFVLAVLYTALNCLKPLLIDDAAYFYYAQQVAHKPLDPYGFAVYWYSRPLPANWVLAPPVLPYLWAPSVAVFGLQPWLWKLSLFPLALLFVWALHDLFRRFASGLEIPLTWMTVLSPAFLPSFNLMLDVPALALSLGAIAVFLRAVDRQSFPLASVAGLLAGLGMETKYTGFLAPAVMLVAALVHRRPLLWVAAGVIAAQVFASWELITAVLYGESHFLYALRDSGSGPLAERIYSKAALLAPMLAQLGGIGAAVFLVGLAGLGLGRRGLAVAATVVVLTILAVAIVPLSLTPYWTLEHLLFLVLGLVGFGVMVLVVARLAVLSRASPPASAGATGVLLGWLVLEVLGYFPLTPFPAVRRVFGVFVVLTLLVGNLASRRIATGEGWKTITAIACFGCALGFLYYGVDLLDASTTKAVAVEGVARAQALGTGHVWYVGHWGFQFYAEAAGMKPVVVEDYPFSSYVKPAPASSLQEGDLIVVPDGRVVQQEVYLDPDKVEPVSAFAFRDSIPFKTVMCFYGGSVPLQHQGAANRLEVMIYRVKRDCTLERSPPPAP